MSKNIIHTEHAPAAIGPYSQAIRAGSLLYTAGQIPLDPATGQLVEDEISVQTDRALRNLQAILEAAGGGLRHVVKTTVFLKDMGEFAAMNKVYATFFTEEPPARSAVQAAALPLGARIEIEAVAVLPE
jgi:2-iminobutanoate/2-iminopropanoate deaminase